MADSKMADSDLEEACVPTFVVIGAAGDGKSSLISFLLDPSETKPETGLGAKGVTKNITEYRIRGLEGAVLCFVDSMGVGDQTCGVGNLIAGLERIFTDGRKIDGLIVTSHTSTGRMGTASSIVKEIIKHGMVSNASGVGPLERVIVCGTQSDRLDEEEESIWREKTGPDFFDKLIVPKEHQVALISTKKEPFMKELLHSIDALGRSETLWDPEFEKNGGQQKMAEGIAAATGGDPNILTLEIEMHRAWEQWQAELAWRDRQGRLAMGASEAAVRYIAGRALKGEIAETMGQEAMDPVDLGNLVAGVGTKASIVAGVSAGTDKVVAGAGFLAETLAGRSEYTREYKKPIGFGAQVGTGAAMGASAAGATGAAVGGAAGAVSWSVGQFGGTIVEVIAEDATIGPKEEAYLAAKDKYESALNGTSEW